MNSAFTYTALDVEAAKTWADFQLSAWGLSPHLVNEWLAAASQFLSPGDTARVVLNYQRHDQMLSFDVWIAGRHVYGVDHLCGTGAVPPPARRRGRARQTDR